MTQVQPQTAEELFNAGIERYHAGEDAATLLPVFKEVCDRSPRTSAAYTCLAWLYLLTDQPEKALKAAQKATKINPEDPQARVNLAIAMLESGKKGVREHVDLAGRIALVSEELRQELQESFDDGLKRKPDWQALVRVRHWVLGDAP
jgi:tetratricopeptide (TPR) repeat protein